MSEPRPPQLDRFHASDHHHWVGESVRREFLLDFLSDKAAASVLNNLTHAQVKAAANHEADGSHPAHALHALEVHPLASVLSAAWKTAVARAVADTYAELSEGRWPEWTRS